MGRRVPLQFLQTLNGDGSRGLFPGNVATEIGHGMPSSKHPNVLRNISEINQKNCPSKQNIEGREIDRCIGISLFRPCANVFAKNRETSFPSNTNNILDNIQYNTWSSHIAECIVTRVEEFVFLANVFLSGFYLRSVLREGFVKIRWRRV